ncbi:MAG: ShlB/FhaC/HecB family hemolysin secretion/activation protein [Azoarcus sp.]|nr:ShlB/FhaC/HecB family hemolysin secretion/activation protein [Azoarcus sp.]
MHAKSDFGNGDFRLETEGWSRAHNLRLERVAHRDDVSKTTVSAALDRTETKNYIEDIRLDASSVRLTEAGLGLTHGRRLGNAYFNLDLGWQRGLPLLGAERDRHLPREAAHAQYNKYTFIEQGRADGEERPGKIETEQVYPRSGLVFVVYRPDMFKSPFTKGTGYFSRPGLAVRHDRPGGKQHFPSHA